MATVFPDIVKDCPKMRNLPKIFLTSFDNVGQVFSSLVCLCLFQTDLTA